MTNTTDSNLTQKPTSMTDTTNSTLTQKTTSMTDTTNLTSILSTDSSTITDASPSSFVAPTCSCQNTIGANCNTSSVPCDMLQPCQNSGTCINTNTTVYGYNCTCPLGIDGEQCQFDNRPCDPNTCWNNGICNETSDTTFECLCENGWTNIHCEVKVNYCEQVKCLNNGVCRQLFLNYTCECLGTSYSGRHCEIVATTTVISQAVAKSLGYIAILFLIGAVSFFVIMDILKYGFRIDATKDELAKIQRSKVPKKAKRPPIIQKFVYVNTPSQRPPAAKIKKENLNIQETTV